MQRLEVVLRVLKTAGYLECKLVNGVTVDNINFLPLGSLLLEKVRQECRLDRGGINSYFMSAQNEELVDLAVNGLDPLYVFRTHRFRDNLLNIKHAFQKEVPLAIKEDCAFKNDQEYDCSNFSVNFPKGTLVSSSYFVNESVATEYFHKIQRERKIWWMRLSANPGRYFLSDLKAQESDIVKCQSVKIKSKFNFGDLEVEKITVVPIMSLGLNNLEDFDLYDLRLQRSITPAVVRSELCLENAVLGILMDSVENTDDGKISINKRMAPYQCGVFCFTKDEKILLELDELAVHITNSIRKVGLSALNLRKCQTNSEQVLAGELKEMDHIGVPFSLILSEDSLRTGIMKLRSRDTELSEIIHITDVPEYLLKIFKM